MSDDTNKPLEQSAEGSSGKTTDTVTREVNSNRAGLVDKQKDYINYLKNGGTSGISAEFGKPLWLISEARAGESGSEASAEDSLARRVSESFKVIQGESLLSKAAPANSPDSAAATTGASERSDRSSDTAGGDATNADKSAARPPIEEDRHAEIKQQKPLTKPGEILMPTQVIVGSYQGEVIHKDVEPAVVINTKGETLKQIAKDHLGPGATEEEINKHVTEIARINHIKNPDKPLDGQELKLPGHTKDGGFVLADKEGNKRTLWHDGTVRVENVNGTGYVRKLDGTNEVEHHWGRNPEDNYELKRTADGKYLVADANKDNFHDPGPHDARVERAKLQDLADARITDPVERQQFENDMRKFDERSQELQKQYEKQGMKPEEAHKKAQEEIAKTYEQVQKLLEENDKAPIDDKKRIELAEQVMNQAANPSTVDQGGTGTCNTATLENRAYTQNPSEAARLVADVATKGEYISNGTPPVTVKFDKKQLEPHGESKKNPPDEGARSYASEIFQVTGVNLHYAKKHQEGGPDIRYEQVEPRKGAVPPDNGERLMDYSDPKHPKPVMEDGKPVHEANLHAREIADINKQILKDKSTASGKEGPSVIEFEDSKTLKDLHQQTVELKSKSAGLSLAVHGIGDGSPIDPNNKKALADAHEAIDKKEGLKPEDREKLHKQLHDLEEENTYRDDKGIAVVKDQKELEATLAKMKAEGRLPAVVVVYTYHEPFNHESGNPDSGDHGGHVVTVKDYHPAQDGKPATIEMDNQWGKDYDHLGDKAIPVSDLLTAMKPSETNAELDSLAKKKAEGTISQADYEKELKEIMLKAERRWNQEAKDGNFSLGEHDNVAVKWKEMVNKIQPKSRAKQIYEDLREDMKKEGMTDPSNKFRK